MPPVSWHPQDEDGRLGTHRQYEPEFADNYLRLVRACADGYAERDAIVHLSRELGFLTGEELPLQPLSTPPPHVQIYSPSDNALTLTLTLTLTLPLTLTLTLAPPYQATSRR